MVGLGYKIDRTNPPLIVPNPVYAAIARTGTFPFYGCRASKHFVPANKVTAFESSLGEYICLLGCIGFFMIGIDSPVNMDSFIIHEPFNSMQSHGTVQSSLTSIKSPGTIAFELNFYLFYETDSLTITSLLFIVISLLPLKTCSTVSYDVIFLSFSKFYFVSLNETNIEITEVKNMTTAYS